MKQKRYLLDESELPKQWYNIQADMPNKPLPPIHPATKQPLGVDDLPTSSHASAVCRSWTQSIAGLTFLKTYLRSTSTTALHHWFVPMPSKKHSALQPISISRMRVPVRWVLTRSTLPCPSATMPRWRARRT